MPHGRAGEYTPVMSRRSVLVVDGWRLELERKKTRESRVRRVARSVRSGWCARYHTRAAPRTHGDDATRSYGLQRGTRQMGGQEVPLRKERFDLDKTHCDTAWRLAGGVWGLRTFFLIKSHVDKPS